ncbi:MAG: alcohol dehydrogenase catalytic domain-containing protein [Planctomycetales bacterium]
MQALRLTSTGIQFITDAPTPEPSGREIRIRVTCAGICETDLQLMQGYMGFHGMLGHEFVGVAENGRYAGQRVVGEINSACHACDLCKASLETHCTHRTVLGILGRDGAFADYLLLPEENLHPVPDALDDRIAVFTEPLAAAFQIGVQVPDLAGKSILVLGDGRLGNLCAQVLHWQQGRVEVIGKHPDKLRLLQNRNIPTSLLSEVQPEKRFDIVVDATGHPSGFETALQFLKSRGTLVLKTTVAAKPPLHLAPLVIDEITVVGSRCGPFAPALQALAQGVIETQSLIADIRPLREGVQALHDVASRRTLKTLLIP